MTKKEAREKPVRRDFLVIHRWFGRRLALWVGTLGGSTEYVLVQGWFKPKLVDIEKYRKYKIIKGLKEYKLPRFI
jgi:hypothetical protein